VGVLLLAMLEELVIVLRWMLKGGMEDLKSKIFYLNIFIYYFRRTSSRCTAGSDSTSRRLDYDISPVRGGGSEDTSVKGNRDNNEEVKFKFLVFWYLSSG